MNTIGEVLINCIPLLWLPFPWYTRKLSAHCKDISTLHPQEPSTWPTVSIIVAACNEEDTITNGLSSLLNIDYPNFEVIVVNDRSTDGTKDKIEAFDDARLRTVHIQDLPKGWLGKVHALHQGANLATGSWMLFTDADVQFSKHSLKKSIAICLEEDLAHLTLLPWMYSASFWAQTCISSALTFISISQKPWHVSNPDRKEALGAGAFNLVHSETFRSTLGFTWLKMEVADDIGLGHMMKRATSRSQFYTAIDDIQVEWYPSLPLAVRGLEKNAFSQIAHFSLMQGVFFSCFLIILSLVPIFALFGDFVPWSLGLVIFCALYSSRKLMFISRISYTTLSMSFVVGHLLLAYILLRSSIRGFLRGGIIWRDTTYPTKELREGMRVHFLTGNTHDE